MADDCENLIRRLGESLQADDGLHAYVLVDPMLREPLETSLLAWNGCAIQPVPVKHPSLRDDQRPRLAALRPQAVDVLRASLVAATFEQSDPDREAAQGFAVGGWLLSPYGIVEVAQHLGQMMSFSTVQGMGRRYLRLADRRVFEWLWATFDTTQRAAMLGPIVAWTTLDRCDHLQRFAASAEAPADAAKMPLILRTDQWARLQLCETVQALLRGWQRFADQLPPDYLQRAADAVLAAKRIGLDNQRDILLLGAYQLQVHPRICEHPQVIEAVERTRCETIALFEALESIPDPDGWDRIRQQLEHAGAPRQVAAAGT